METSSIQTPHKDYTVTFDPHTRRCRAGAALGAATAISMFLAGPWFFWPVGLLLGLLHRLVAGLQLHTDNPRAAWRLNLYWGAAMVGGMCMIFPLMVRCITLYIPFEGKLLMNLMCSGMVFCLFLALSGGFRWSVNAAVAVLLILATVNGYVFMFRDRELTFLDIFSAATALKVSAQYSFWPSGYILCGWSVTVLGLMVQFSLPRVTLQRRSFHRIAAAMVIALSLLTLQFGARSYLPERWRTNGSIKNGYLLNFYLGLRDAFIREPEDYSPETVGQLEQDYISQPETGPAPNILVIMSESYFDPRVYPQALTAQEPITPFWNSLRENTIRGYALSSVYGGNTANSEFEFLTGSSMAFLPGGSVPYTQYIHENSYSLAWVLKSYGYSCRASHCYHALGWNRDQVYPLLGFEESRFLDQYPQEDVVRSYISDSEHYDMMLQMLDAQAAPAFLFGVTMQNHGGYQEDRQTYDHCVTLTGAYTGFDMAEQYFSLLTLSDRALEGLLDKLKTYPEDTIVLIFGDHQPKLEPEFYQALNGGALDSLSDQMLQHTVPFLIWANYDIPERDLGLTSLNYLSGHLLDAAQLERTAYHRYLGTLEKTIPAMNALGYWSNTQGGFIPYELATGDEAKALRDYELVQYNALFDRENSSLLFFDQYLPPEPIKKQDGQ